MPSKPWKSLPVKEETYARLDEERRKRESWDEFMKRLMDAAGVPPLKPASETARKASA